MRVPMRGAELTARSRRSGGKVSNKDSRRTGGVPPERAADPVRRLPSPEHESAASPTGQPASALPSAARWRWLKTWWGRLVGVAVGVGAIAGAITTVESLRPDPDPVDFAAITSSQVTRPEQLSNFKPTVRLRSETSAVTTDTTEPTRPVPISAPPLRVPPIVGLSDLSRAQLYDDIRAQEVLSGFALPELPPSPPMSAPNEPGQGARAFSVVAVNAVDENGDPVPAQEAAEELADRLGTVRTTPTSEGEDPLGMRVTVNLDIEGLRDQPLLLYWRLVQAGETPVPHAWAEWFPAAEVIPTSERDSGFATTWVPLPVAPGPYRAEVVLMQESSNAQLISQLTEPFGG